MYLYDQFQACIERLGAFYFLYAYLCLFLYTMIHEAGHALMAICLGTRVTRFQVGCPVWFRFKWGRAILRFGLLFPRGRVSYRYEDDAPRWKVMLATLSGPLLPLILYLPVFVLAGTQPLTILPSLIVAISTLGNLNPFHRGSDGQKIYSHVRALCQGRKTLNT